MYGKYLAILGMAIGFAQSHPVVVHPTPLDQVNKSTFVITKQDTLNATSVRNQRVHDFSVSTASLQMDLVNNLGGSVNAYVTGLDSNGALFLLQTDGSYYYPPNPPAGSIPQPINANVAIPLGPQRSTTTINLRGYVSSGRVWFAAGNLAFFVNYGSSGPSLVEPSPFNPSDPSSGISWGFAELSWTAAQLFADISYVDFVGLPIGIQLAGSAGIQSAQGLPGNAVSTICSSLQQQSASDGQPWDQLCVVDGNGKPLRVLAAEHIFSGVDNAFSNYWTGYVNQVWDYYTNNDLTVNTPFGDYVGRVNPSSDNLEFSTGDSFSRPTAGDIFGCNSGPFANSGDSIHLAIVPRLCAAFNRGTFLRPRGDVQPNGVTNYAHFYLDSPNNQFSRFVHADEIDGKGYAFPYDDVTPSGGQDLSGSVADPSPTLLTLTVGGP